MSAHQGETTMGDVTPIRTAAGGRFTAKRQEDYDSGYLLCSRCLKPTRHVRVCDDMPVCNHAACSEEAELRLNGLRDSDSDDEDFPE